MLNEEITRALFLLQDTGYRDFQSKLIPTVDPDTIIGVRTPYLRKLAGDLTKRDDISVFLETLPHRYFDENQLHGFLLSGIKDFDRCLEAVDRFLPYVDNWATCDQLSPRVFRTHRPALLPAIEGWIASGETYKVRFGVGMLMAHYLDQDFEPRFMEMAAEIRSEEYYVNMMIAWYFATALAKQYEAALPYLEERQLPVWIHNKTIQKAVESRRITPEQKTYLKGLRIHHAAQAAPQPED